MNAVKTIFKKELHRVFKDRKMLFSTFIFPVLIMVIVYGIMGSVVGRIEENIASHIPVVYVANAGSEEEAALSKELGMMSDIRYISAEQAEDAKQLIKDGSADLLVVFPDDFSSEIAGRRSVPDVGIYYDPSSTQSQTAFAIYSQGFSNGIYKYYLAERVGGADKLDVFTINAGGNDYTLDEDSKGTSQMLSMIVPYLVLLLLFTGAMTLGTDVIAGEKERGTMGALLLTPASRTSIAMGKLLALTLMSVISATIYAVTLLIMLPKAMAGTAGAASFSITPQQGIMVFIIVIALAFLFVCVVTLISVFARTVKEAQSYTSPVMILVVIAGVLTMVDAFGGSHGLLEYAIPVYGSALCLSDIFTGGVDPAAFAVCIASTLAVGVILTVVIARVFNNERIMLNV
ncbi:MAG: ABC transporter permease [Lachnospiraceae bacterium]|nr:ABC transporter permease [Lachnospiraceae bacterium]